MKKLILILLISMVSLSAFGSASNEEIKRKAMENTVVTCYNAQKIIFHSKVYDAYMQSSGVFTVITPDRNYIEFINTVCVVKHTWDEKAFDCKK